MARITEFFREPRQSRFTKVGGVSADGLSGDGPHLPGDPSVRKTNFAGLADEIAAEVSASTRDTGDSKSLRAVRRSVGEFLATLGEYAGRYGKQEDLEYLVEFANGGGGESPESESLWPTERKPITEERSKAFADGLREFGEVRQPYSMDARAFAESLR